MLLGSSAARAEVRWHVVDGPGPAVDAALAAADHVPTEEMLVVMDVDETAIWTMQTPLEPSWYGRMLHEGWSRADIASFQALRLSRCRFFPTEVHLERKLVSLAFRGISFLFVTARTEAMVDTTEEVLRRYGLLSPRSAPTIPAGALELKLAAKDSRPGGPRAEGELLYRNGVLYVGGFDKAAAVDALYGKLRKPAPSHLFVADDRVRHLREFERAEAGRTIELFHVRFLPTNCHTLLAEEMP